MGTLVVERGLAYISECFLFGAVASFLFVLLSMKPSGDFRVIGPSHLIVSRVGEDALLTCQLHPKKTVLPTNVTWYRLDSSTPVFTLLDGSEVTEKQLEEYRGRVEWIEDNIAEGRVSLKIYNTQPSDDGQYWCRFQEGDYYVETSLYLKVANLGSTPSIHMAGSTENEFQLLCAAKGWFPEPRIHWKSTTGEKLLTFSERSIQEEDGLFYVEATHVVRNAAAETVSCIIHNPVLHEQKDATISIPDKLQTELASLKVIGPSQPILVRFGEDVNLTCSLSPKANAQDMEVRWVKGHYYPAVYVYMNGDHVAGEQMEEYRGRTTLVSDSINEGTVTLQIHKARTSDDGQYRCLFEKDGVYQEASLDLKIVGMGSSPVITMKEAKDGEVQLKCTSDGWFPRPLVQWKDVEGKTIQSLSEVLTEGSHGLFHVETHLLVTNSSVVNVTCSISNPLLSEEKATNFSFSGWCHFIIFQQILFQLS
ncbi:butyrophilin-like protein 2 [Sorex araneus]|uniref:butyrophilin-like protein 2 n=1 Tax=Sorex araneus TaxID=42254 RepID=UPI002433D860|nr:butyrophilin-like protein 2 [Sorex araneus]